MEFMPEKYGRFYDLKFDIYPQLDSSRSDVIRQSHHFYGNQWLDELHDVVEGSRTRSVVIQGPSGCGKTSLWQQYVSCCGRCIGESVMVIHLGEQIDSKLLLGTFTCTSVPGEFVWTPGLLTRCVLSGHWIIMEDIDHAPSDVISLLLPLIKTGKLCLPGYYEPITAPSSFRLFLTQRTNSLGNLEAGHVVSGLLRILEDHSVTVTLPALTSDDIQKIMTEHFPEIELLSKKLSETVLKQCYPLRYLLKVCRRIAPQITHSQLTSATDMIQDIIDCFCGHLPQVERITSAQKLTHLCGGHNPNVVQQLCSSNVPTLQCSPTVISIGRAYVTCKSSSIQRSLCFSHTPSSLRLLEAVCRCVQMAEPVLLVGETGVGKTFAINYLANITGNKLIVMNLSQQTDSIDLLGGYKPVQMVHIFTPLKEEFDKLFRVTFSSKQNAHFLANIQACLTKHQWKKLLKLMIHSMESAQKRTKKANKSLSRKWDMLGIQLKKLRQQLLKSQTFAFSFDKGALVEAVSEGWWILLDEVNLASAETLQCLSAVLEAPANSMLFVEKPDSEPITRHPDFRLFCCMNPSTDVGKKSLPESIRNRFTELYVDEPTSVADLTVLVEDYLKNQSPSNSLVETIVRLFGCLKELSRTKLVGGTGRSPHYSLRNHCRALEYASKNYFGHFEKSLYEGFCMSFLTELCQDHHQIVIAEIVKCLSLSEAVLTSVPKGLHISKRDAVLVAGYWLSIGKENTITDDNYILTPSVRRNLHNLARVVSARKYPVLLQGPTSAGKTSLVQYLAKATGHRCLRINNHEHTDLQEYIGMYVADEKGQLVFQEGVLVEAMRNGYWVVLDELNLAPTDVLEALNRVLDDNRELFIPETRKLVKAHPQFILFGTQNPAGAYGGRKVLSRAFRNRFIELHYDDIPSGELVKILQDKSKIPLSYAKKMVAVMKELQVRRTSSGVFAGKYGLITLRDLFRWAERYCRSPNMQKDWEQQLAEDGFMLLAGRLREADDEQVVLNVIQRHFRRTVRPCQLFGQDGGPGSLASKDCLQLLHSPFPEEFSHLVLTSEFLRMAVLAFRALNFDEPILLVGDTGCGKTTLCQIFSKLLNRKLVSINCHMHTEAADFLGGLKPTRNRTSDSGSVGLFEWQDGVVVNAMVEGCCLLIDEISLADDAVLERLNSVLETERKLLVSERSRSQSQNEVFQITATPGFAFMATMNPGGDYGKKELSPALRNRFVEIWCPCSNGDEDLVKIIDHNIKIPSNIIGISWSDLMLRTLHWFRNKLPFGSVQISVRDLLTWINFMNTTNSTLSAAEAFYHGAHLVFIDSLGCSGQFSVADKETIRSESDSFLQNLLENHDPERILSPSVSVEMIEGDLIGIHPFFIKRGPGESVSLDSYCLQAPGPCRNVFRLLRGLQVGKPLLIEGPPGVGKTSLVTALSKASGHRLARINLSEQTDISDLFGCDLPVEGGGGGVRFEWRDGPLLRALKRGDWILLDEINLASQSVLEGLNAVLDHRGEVFVPELGITFFVQPTTKLFACQNPMAQGGGRKGLPKSFLNRFTMVFVDVLSEDDFQFITHSLFPAIPLDTLQRMIYLNSQVEIMVKKECGSSLWEFNLRDILRWCQLMTDQQISDPGMLVDLIYCQRLRTSSLRVKVIELYKETFGVNYSLPRLLGGCFIVTDDSVQVGHTVLQRKLYGGERGNEQSQLEALPCQYSVLEALMMCVKQGWMSILVGGGKSGKSSVLQTLARIVGQKLVEFPMNSDTDTTELLGGFQQVNMGRHFYNLAKVAEDLFYELQINLSKLQNAMLYSSKLMEMKENLPGVSRILEEYTNIELMDLCGKLKQCITDIKEIESHLQIKPSYDTEQLLDEVTSLIERTQCNESSGQFEWVDSVLVTALRYGHWLYITNCNVCNPSVLDRLNALVEPDGVLYIDERGVVGGGGVMAIHPHPNFRLFLVMNPVHGEISRAMRNRGIEICLLHEQEDQLYALPESSKAIPPLVSVICQTPDTFTALSHFSVVLKTIADSSCPGFLSDMNVTAALQVFTDHATITDHPIRFQLLKDLISSHVDNSQYPSGEAGASLESLKFYVNHQADFAIKKKGFLYNLPQLVSYLNPLISSLPDDELENISKKGKRLVAGARLTSLQECLRWQSSRPSRSALSLSHKASSSKLQPESLIHPSLQHIQPLLSIFLKHLLSLSQQLNSIDLQKVIGWISVIIHCLSKPIHSVTELAGLWTLLRTQCIAPYSTLFPDELNSLKNLQPLDRDVQHCLFFAKVHDKYLESGFSSVHCAPADIPTPLKEVQSDYCFKHLGASSDSVYTIGEYRTKVKQIQILLQKLWLSGCSTFYNPLFDSERKVTLTTRMLESIVISLGSATNSILTEISWNSRKVFELCSEVEKALPTHKSSLNWHKVFADIESAYHELSETKKSLELAYNDIDIRDPRRELEILSSLSRGCLTVGIILSQVLLPTNLDPVCLKEVHFRCHQMLVSQQAATVEACNRHYLTTIGRSLSDMMRSPSSEGSFLPGVRGGISPYLISVVERKEECEKNLQTVQPPVHSSGSREKYSQITSLCNDVVHTFASTTRLSSLLTDSMDATPLGQQRVDAWSRALKAAMKQISSEEFCSLSDVVKPFISALLQIHDGITALSIFQSSLLSPKFVFVPLMRDICQFPFYSSSGASGSAMFLRTILDAIEIVGRDSTVLDESRRHTVHKNLLILGVQTAKGFSTLYHQITSISTHLHLSSKQKSMCSALLKSCWSLWKTAEDEARLKSEQESSLYRYRTTTHHIHLTEEGGIGDEIVRQMFPVYDKEFYEERSEMTGAREEEATSNEEYPHFTASEMTHILQLHQILFSPVTLANCYNPSEIFKLKYSLSYSLSLSIGCYPGLSTNYSLCGAHTRRCKEILTDLTEEHATTKVNVYKEAIVSEAVRAEPIVNELKARVEEFLLEWPDHPGLVQIKKSCEKLLSLSVQQPLMKILAGLEYILRKSQDWESFAASHVSLSSQLEQLTQLILDWRRLELKSWESLLEGCSSEVEQEGSKWWFHLFSLCQEFISDNQNIKDFLSSVHQFIEVSPIGEFTIRLHLLQTFSQDMLNRGHSALGLILVNSFYYYQQFLPTVLSHSAKLTSTIDKEFRDHIRIMRWNDGNYWALKASTEKSHRALVKFMRKFKEVLAEPSRPLLTAAALQKTDDNDSSHGIEVQTTLAITPQSMPIKLTVEQEKLLHSVSLQTVDMSEEQGGVELTAANILCRMKQMLHEYSSCIAYSDCISTVDDITGEIIETIKKLQSLEFLNQLEGEKRKKAIKLNLQQKRNGIIELFKCLKKQGLSYRNEVEFGPEMNSQIFQLPSLHELNIPSRLRESIQKYFYLCIARLASLQSAFVTPTKDLPSAQLKRCKGYAGHFMQLLSSQRKVFSEASTCIHILQHQVEQLQFFVDKELYTIQTQYYSHWQGTMLEVVEMCLELVVDFERVVESIPQGNDTSTLTTDSPLPLSEDRSLVNNALTLLQGMVQDLISARNILVTKENSHERFNVPYFSRNDVLLLTDVCSLIDLFCCEIGRVLESLLGEKTHRVAMFDFLVVGRSYLSSTTHQCRQWISSLPDNTLDHTNSGEPEEDSGIDSVSILRNLVLAVQKVMLRHKSFMAEADDSSEDLSDFPCCLKLHSTLTESIKHLKARKVIDDITVLLSTAIAKMNVERLVPVLPLLQQYLALLKKIVTNLVETHRVTCKLTSILLALFSDIVSKGVCAPPEVEEGGEGIGTDFEPAEGGGFDEGQGTKNVSDEVDAEDLEEAFKKSQEEDDTSGQGEKDRERGDDDENAVDMSEEFCGDITDLPESGSEDENEEGGGEDEIDKEMGEIGEDTPEQIDRNMWVPEEELDEEQTEMKESEDKNGGSAESEESRIVANEDTKTSAKSEDSQEPQHVDEETGSQEYEDYNAPLEQESECVDQNQSEFAESENEKEGADFDIEDMDITGDVDDDEHPEEYDMDQDVSEEHREEEVVSTEETKDEPQESEVTSAQSMEAASSSLDVPAVTPEDSLPQNSSQTNERDKQETNEESKNNEPSDNEAGASGPSTALPGKATSTHEDENEIHQRQHRRPEEDYTLAEAEERAVKRPRLLEEGTEDQTEEDSRHNDGQDIQMVEHVRVEDDMEHDAVVWDAAPPQHVPGILPPTDTTNPSDVTEDVENHAIITPEEVDGEKLWHKYEVLMSGLAQCLCDELRLVLLPTQASQLKGDYRTGKRLSMRRIIPYIASHFQNDQIWLRRTKPNRREYQVLMAVDDSASMNENECSEMAYGSLAMISSALNRLECGQIGILRFGEAAELLHAFDKPFTVHTGAHILQHLSFSQTKTNFVEMLQMSHSLFSESLYGKRSRSSPAVSQLLLILSDGRGVFADGTTAVEMAVRRVTELGVVTVFVILDSISKDSVLNIKVPSFIPGRAPIIRSYLETFPFSFYIVLQDIKSLPVVLGKALQQWFQLIS